MEFSESPTMNFDSAFKAGSPFGAEASCNHLKYDNTAREISTSNIDVVSVNTTGLSVFARGTIGKEKLNFFARTDFSTPLTKFGNK